MTPERFAEIEARHAAGYWMGSQPGFRNIQDNRAMLNDIAALLAEVRRLRAGVDANESRVNLQLDQIESLRAVLHTIAWTSLDPKSTHEAMTALEEE